jgi:outer membrane protein OmpA-like peptidoglycan-associated protein
MGLRRVCPANHVEFLECDRMTCEITLMYQQARRRMTMKFDRKVLLAGLVAPAFAAATAYGAEPGFYIGASGGQSTLEASGSTPRLSVMPYDGNGESRKFDINEDDTGYKGYIGYQFLPWLGVEGGYVELGNVSKDFMIGDTQVDGELSAGGWEGFVVASLPLGPFDVFAKVGGFTGDIKADGKIKRPGMPSEHFSESSDSESMLAYGGGIAYNFGHGHWSLRTEYEEYDTSNLDKLYLVSAGLTYHFFHDKAKPAPAAAPVVAAAPTKCADSDGDGVCNTDDQCPNTPPGKRVGPAGCDCDYTLRTHFAFDSAELTAQDKAELDKLAVVLTNPKLHFIAGEIDGYTDDVGEAAYNEKLSKRRADAVASYLESKGVAVGSRFATHGYGEENPIADNKTDEGRAQNRRVTIRRTDCGPAN